MTNKYTWTRIKGHPFSNSSDYIRGHRAAWEKANNAILLPWASIHHKNGRKCDNNVENLEVMTKARHIKLHNPRLGTGRENPVIDCACGCGRKLLRYDRDYKARRFIHGHNRRKGVN